MYCPVCTTTTLALTSLAPTLPAHACARCGGRFIRSTDYWAWLEHQDEPDHPHSQAPAAAEPARAKRCPGCGYLLLPSPVAIDLGFAIDQCGHCNSFWLDAGEWDSLVARGLHGQLHHITGDPWQRALRAQRGRQVRSALDTQRLGEADYAEARRVRAWLRQHPARDLLLAILTRDEE